MVLLLDASNTMNYNSYMYPATTVTSKGQITIPLPVRKKLGIKPGDKLVVSVVNNDSIELVSKSALKLKAVKQLGGSLKSSVPYADMDTVREVVGKKIAERYEAK